MHVPPPPTLRVVNTAWTRWRVVQHSRPAPECEHRWANAIPHRGRDATAGPARPANRVRWDLCIADWSDTPAATGTFEIRWLFAATAFGGGAFMTRLWVEACDLRVDSGFDLNVRLVTGRPRNVGSANEPIASLPAVLEGSLSGPAGDIAVHRRFEVRGDGSFRDAA